MVLLLVWWFLKILTVPHSQSYNKPRRVSSPAGRWEVTQEERGTEVGNLIYASPRAGPASGRKVPVNQDALWPFILPDRWREI